MKKLWILSLIAAGILLLSACGSCDNTDENGPPPEDDIVQANYGGVMQDEETGPPVRSLSILAPSQYEPEIRRAMLNLNIQQMLLPEDARVEWDFDLNFYYWTDWEQQVQRLQVMLMAGEGYDLFFLDGHPLWNYAESGFLADFYALIDADPLLNRGDFFHNPLAAMEINGGLYAMPMSFGFTYVLINAELPESIIQRFSQHSTITFSELMDIYIDLQLEYGHEFGHLHFYGGASPFVSDGPRRVMESYMASFIDMDSRTVDLVNDQFFDFLNRHSQVFDGWSPAGRGFVAFGRASNLVERAELDAFFITSGYQDPAFSLFEYVEQPYFLHGIPISDANGRLLIAPEHRHMSGTITVACILAGGNTDNAWEFTKQLINIFNDFAIESKILEANTGVSSSHNWLVSSPILHSLYESHMPLIFDQLFSFNTVRDGDPDVLRQYVDDAVAKLAAFNEMPMAMAFPFVPDHVGLEDDIDQFTRGLISAEVLAQRMQNSISLWLIGG